MDQNIVPQNSQQSFDARPLRIGITRRSALVALGIAGLATLNISVFSYRRWSRERLIVIADGPFVGGRRVDISGPTRSYVEPRFIRVKNYGDGEVLVTVGYIPTKTVDMTVTVKLLATDGRTLGTRRQMRRESSVPPSESQTAHGWGSPMWLHTADMQVPLSTQHMDSFDRVRVSFERT